MLLQFISSLLIIILSLTIYFLLRYERKHGGFTLPNSSTTTKDESKTP
jgi:hypothetical protein